MLQKLACRMGMGESGHRKLQIPARPRWPVDALSYRTCAMLAGNLNQPLRKEKEGTVPGQCLTGWWSI
jgi:hypothetical protein